MGGTQVRISGRHFIQAIADESQIKCRFGAQSSTVVAGYFIDSRTITCTSPPASYLSSSRETTVSVEVSVNHGATFSNNRVLFNYVSGSVLVSTEPASGPVHGGTRLLVHVENLDLEAYGVDLSSAMEHGYNNYFYCRFSSGEDLSDSSQDASFEARMSRVDI